jgi:SAM-dependent methyltransferase
VRAFDRAYFDRWYRHPQHRVRTPTEVARDAHLVVAMGEYFLGRPARSVLDVGCGEGTWRPHLLRLRPRIRYQGVDPSEYVVSRFGARRNIRLGGFGSLDALELHGPFDLVICAGVLNYVADDELRRGLATIARLVGGLAYLEIFTSADDVVGDVRGRVVHSASWYRAALRRARLHAVGAHGYVGQAMSSELAALERLPDARGSGGKRGA